ncbi:hypothetical protein [Paraburkholderia sp. BL27I4N3]|uniref:hypothetical protein n=1 Tax=Paraburkholderia sp. BL27I4N3 TaxID=1938805 RepID=UPI001C6E4182|nr:hypothetical protein [Paraburkholderia sp. BL27I4N3]
MPDRSNSKTAPGPLRSPPYDPADPHATQRLLDDTWYTLDHVHTRLLKLAEGFQATTGARLASIRHDRPQPIRDELSDEI